MNFKSRYEAMKLAKIKEQHADMDQEQFKRAFGFLYKMKPPKTAAQYESLISEYVHAHGGICTKVSVTGRQIVKKTHVTDVTGRSNTITDSTFIPSTTIKGTSDLVISSGPYVLYCEIKIGNDRQSQDQKNFEAKVVKSGAKYVIVKTLDDFYNVWNEFTKT